MGITESSPISTLQPYSEKVYAPELKPEIPKQPEPQKPAEPDSEKVYTPEVKPEIPKQPEHPVPAISIEKPPEKKIEPSYTRDFSKPISPPPKEVKSKPAVSAKMAIPTKQIKKIAMVSVLALIFI